MYKCTCVKHIVFCCICKRNKYRACTCILQWREKSTIKPLSHTLLNLKTKFLGKMKWHQHKSRSTCIYSDAISYAHISFLTANSWLSFTMYLDWFCILLPVGVSLDGLRCLVWKWTVSWEPINKFYFCFYFWHFFLLIWINYVHAKIFFR